MVRGGMLAAVLGGALAVDADVAARAVGVALIVFATVLSVIAERKLP